MDSQHSLTDTNKVCADRLNWLSNGPLEMELGTRDAGVPAFQRNVQANGNALLSNTRVRFATAYQRIASGTLRLGVVATAEEFLAGYFKPCCFFAFATLLLLGICGCQQSEPLRESEDKNGSQSKLMQPATAAAMKTRQLEPNDWFEDVTEESGVDFTYRNGREGGQYCVLETVGGGVAMFDYDCDGDLDLFFPGGGQISSRLEISGRPPALYCNLGDMQFREVTEEAGFNTEWDYSLGCAAGDYDCDGFPDLLVTCYGESQLWHNNQDGTFSRITSLGSIAFEEFSTAACWADVNRDGLPDLYVVGYVQYDPNANADRRGDLKLRKRIAGPWQYAAASDRLFLNLGNGEFRDVTTDQNLQVDGKGLGVLACDFNGDNWLDFYVANDTTRNHLYWGGTSLLQESGLGSGAVFDEYGTPQGSMGVDFGDVNGDGIGDFFITNYEMEDNAHLQGLGNGNFEHRALSMNLAPDCRRYVGFGTGFADFNNDGWLDLFVINGHVEYHAPNSPYNQPAFVYRNVQGKRFEDVTGQAGPYFSIPHPGRGAAIGDLDNDGDTDLVIVHQNEPITVLRNRTAPENWLRVRLHGRQSAPNAVGAVITATYKSLQLTRWIKAGAGYLSQFDQRVLFPVDSDRPVQVTVRWPSGKSEVFRNLALEQTNHLVEGQGSDVTANGSTLSVP